MEKRELELPLELILKIASGRDSDGIPRSASAIGIEKVLNEKETETVTDLFMEDAVTNIYQSGGAAVLTFDFKYNALGIYRKCKQLCEEWLKEQTEGCQFSTTVAPYTLTGQIILIFTQLMFTDGYEYKNEQNQPVYRLILGFDHTATIVLETNQIDYAQIHIRQCQTVTIPAEGLHNVDSFGQKIFSDSPFQKWVILQNTLIICGSIINLTFLALL